MPRLLRIPALAAVLWAASCAPSAPEGSPASVEPPVELAAGFTPRSLAASARGFPAVLPSGNGLQVLEQEDEVWIQTVLGPEAWKPVGVDRVWATPRPREAGFACTGPGPVRLEVDGRPLEATTTGAPDQGHFLLEEDRLVVLVDAPDGPPRTTVFGVRARNGRAADGRWVVRTGDGEAPGIPVYDGLPETIRVTLPRAGTLSLRTVLERAGVPSAEPAATFRLLLDGELLWSARAGAGEDHLVPLPAGPLALRFEVEGRGRGLFFEPIVRFDER